MMKRPDERWPNWGDFFPFALLSAVGGLITIVTVVIAYLQYMFPVPPPYVLAMRERVNYIDPAGRYSIEYPQTWQMKDMSTSDAVDTRFFASNRENSLRVMLFNWPNTLSAQQLTKLLTSYMQETYGLCERPTQERTYQQPDGSIEINCIYDTHKDGQLIHFQIESFIQQQDRQISILTITVRNEQFEEVRDPITDIVNSYTVYPP